MNKKYIVIFLSIVVLVSAVFAPAVYAALRYTSKNEIENIRSLHVTYDRNGVIVTEIILEAREPRIQDYGVTFIALDGDTKVIPYSLIVDHITVKR